MGANGNRKQTLRTNIIQPYESGFLANVDHKDYNAVMGQELDRISTSTKHMFQGLDDLRTEVDERTKALDALHLTVNDSLNRVMLEIGGVKQQLGQGITIDSITDADGNVLSGVLQGMKTDINTANGNVMVALGEITNTNQKFVGEIKRVEDKSDASVQTIMGILTTGDPTGTVTRIAKNESALAIANSNITTIQSVTETTDPIIGKHNYVSQWKVKATTDALTGGIGLVNDGSKVLVKIDADKFMVGRSGQNGTYPFTLEGNTTYLNTAVIKDASIDVAKIHNLVLDMAHVSGSLQSTNWNNNGTGWYLGRAANDGNNGVMFLGRAGGDYVRLDGSGITVYQNNSPRFKAGIL